MRDPWETDDPVEEIPQEAPKTNVNIDYSASALSDPFVDLQQPQTSKAKPYGESSSSESPPNAAKPAVRPLGFLSFNRDNFLQGIIWAEILGKPLSKRGRR